MPQRDVGEGYPLTLGEEPAYCPACGQGRLYDGFLEIARRCGARVVHVTEKGYGMALMSGFEAATRTEASPPTPPG